MKSITYKLVELFVSFIVLPVSFAFQFPVRIKMTIGAIAFLYVLYVLLVVEKCKIKWRPHIDWISFWKQTALRFIFIAIITSAYMYFTDNTQLFNVVIHKPLIWLLFILIYCVFSVYPQELVYRTFFFQRYETFFSKPNQLIFINAVLFFWAIYFLKMC